MEDFDYLIVGAGFAGLVMAERLATQSGKTSLVIDKRDHIGGNCYDYYDAAGVLVHKYGPHYFRTNSDRIKSYLSQFTTWHPVTYTIKAFSDDRYWSFPINLNTFEELIGRPSTTEEFTAWLEAKRVPIDQPANSEEVILSQVGHELYEKFFLGYTLKQWKRHPKDLDASVCGRIPIRTNRDNSYLKEKFQALPADGYTALFNRMLAVAGDKVEVRLNTDFKSASATVRYRHLIYTGPIDEYFGHCLGHLPYRSLRFEHESFTPEQLAARLQISGTQRHWQPAMRVNYPNDYDFTRIVELKHATGQHCDNTTIVREYPEDFGPGKEPYYPIPAPDAAALYVRYAEMAQKEQHVSFVGRLATYRYYNMDQVVGMALAEFDKLKNSTL